MEHEIKVKADDRWMDDSEVSHCLSCKSEFSFLLRKVCVVKFDIRRHIFAEKPIQAKRSIRASRDFCRGLCRGSSAVVISKSWLRFFFFFFWGGGGKRARAPPPFGEERHERAAEIEPS